MARVFCFWLICLVGWIAGTCGELYGISHYVVLGPLTSQLITFGLVLVWIFGSAALTLWVASKVYNPFKF